MVLYTVDKYPASPCMIAVKSRVESYDIFRGRVKYQSAFSATVIPAQAGMTEWKVSHVVSNNENHQ